MRTDPTLCTTSNRNRQQPHTTDHEREWGKRADKKHITNGRPFPGKTRNIIGFITINKNHEILT